MQNETSLLYNIFGKILYNKWGNKWKATNVVRMQDIYERYLKLEIET